MQVSNLQIKEGFSQKGQNIHPKERGGDRIRAGIDIERMYTLGQEITYEVEEGKRSFSSRWGVSSVCYFY